MKLKLYDLGLDLIELIVSKTYNADCDFNANEYYQTICNLKKTCKTLNNMLKSCPNCGIYYVHNHKKFCARYNSSIPIQITFDFRRESIDIIYSRWLKAATKNLVDLVPYGEVSLPENVRGIKLISPKSIHSYRNLDSVELWYTSEQITDLSVLENISALQLSFCNHVIKLPSKLKKVSISNCDMLSDLLPLANAYYVSIHGCKRVIDVGVLQNVHTLSVSLCKYVVNVSKLKNVNNLSLVGLNIFDVSNLTNVKHLTLRDCYYLLDVNPLLSTVSTLIIDRCKILMKYSTIDHPNVHITNCYYLEV